MTYISEFRRNWRPFAATTLGLGSGFSFTILTTSIFAPYLLKEFMWSRSAFALTATFTLVTVVSIPLAGRLSDLVGVRRTALIGVIALPLSFLVMSRMSGDIREYALISALQAIFCATTTVTVYNRVIIHYFRTARGLALALCASGPPLVNALGGPLLNNFVATHGWRQGYQLLALFTALGGAMALSTIGRERREEDKSVSVPPRGWRGGYHEISGNRVFWLMIVALILVNIPQSLLLSQLMLLLVDNGISASRASVMISALSVGILLGRVFSGLALDRFPSMFVATATFGLPAVSLLTIASPWDAPLLLTSAVLLLGFSHGAEADVIAYIVAQNFSSSLFGTVLGLMIAAMSLSSALGAGILSFLLREGGGFAPFLFIASFSVVAGSLVFLFISRLSARDVAYGPSECVVADS